MTDLTIKGMTRKQCEVFIKWYSGSGEQSADYWFDVQRIDNELDVPTPYCNDVKTFPIPKDDDMIMWVE